MSHLTIHPVVRLNVQTTDTGLLDDLEADLPAADADHVASEYDGPHRRDARDGSGERLTARVSYQDDSKGETAAANLYDDLTAHSLPSDATVVHYGSPLGLVKSEDVKDWYENNPSEQPTDEDGEAYIPSAWNPDEHTVSEW